MAWPVDDPPKGELHTTFMDAEGRSVRFSGPANVAVMMHMTRAAAVAYEQTKADYAALPAPSVERLNPNRPGEEPKADIGAEHQDPFTRRQP